MTFVKFESIKRNGHKDYVHDAEDDVIVLEKLDGANASVTATYTASRNNVLTPENTLRGWLEASERLRTSPLLVQHTLYGEWLVSHTVNYKPEAYQKFYLFAVMDNQTGKHLPWEKVEEFAQKLDLPTPKVLFKGKYKDVFGKLDELAGLSELTVEPNTGEGVVVLNETQGFRTKVVTKRFEERADRKHRPAKEVQLTPSMEWATMYATEARMTKVVHKMLDEGLLKPEEMVFKNFGNVARKVLPLILEDMLEEAEEMPEDFNKDEAQKTLNRKFPPVLRTFMQE